MSAKKIRLLLLICLSITFIGLMSFSPTPPPPSNDFEMYPPYPVGYWVQKLRTPVPTGNMKIMVKYQELEPMPPSLTIYNGGTTITFTDDGKGADSVANDSIYSAYVVENIPVFLSTINSRTIAINQAGGYLSFNGHDGTSMPASGVAFDVTSFNNFFRVPLSPAFLSPGDCGSSIVRQNSLFITDLSVVEDHSRTFNVVTSTGNPTGLYTFGNMFTQMANTAHTGISVKNLIKSWLKNYTQSITVNGQIIAPRINVFACLIAPWLNRAKGLGAPTTADIDSYKSINHLDPSRENWEYTLDTLSGTRLDTFIEYAPFKLTAIVNRIDLRGNSAYDPGLNNTGETRFIFTLINLYDQYATGGVGGALLSTAGNPPVQGDQKFGTFPDFLDWTGMNIIFEFGNVQTNLCDAKAFGQKWINLSGYTIPSAAFNDSLDNTITSKVINAGAGAALGKPNGSAINRIRTNERIFDSVIKSNDSGWNATNWEFRQFELNASTGLFQQVPLTNTPVNTANKPKDFSNIADLTEMPITLGTDQDNLINWVFDSVNRFRVLHGNYNIPAMYAPVGSAAIPLLSGAAQVDEKFMHYWDLSWASTSASIYYPTYVYAFGTSNPDYKEIRHQISLNTCQGCHAGETKTLFAQVMPVGYGQSAQYWLDPPDCNSKINFDNRFVTNQGRTTGAPSGVSNYDPVPADSPFLNFMNVSAFLTGRRYFGRGVYGDDSVNNPNDSTMNGLFYVYSPDNSDSHWGTGIMNPFSQKYGYNDLERRKIDLCNLINSSCSPGGAVSISIFSLLSVTPIKE